MKFCFFLFTSLLMLAGCENTRREPVADDLNDVKRAFLHSIFSSTVEEGPFHMQYTLRTVFFSKNLVSLFGVTNVYDCMPHGGRRYEGKTYVNKDGEFKEIVLDDLFTDPSQNEFLRSYCEGELRKNPISYFEGEHPFKKRLELEDVRTFVIDDRFLIILFQSYVAGSGEDGPFFVRIPFEHLQSRFDSGHILFPLLQEIIDSKDFLSSGEEIFGVIREDKRDIPFQGYWYKAAKQCVWPANDCAIACVQLDSLIHHDMFLTTTEASALRNVTASYSY